MMGKEINVNLLTRPFAVLSSPPVCLVHALAPPVAWQYPSPNVCIVFSKPHLPFCSPPFLFPSAELQFPEAAAAQHAHANILAGDSERKNNLKSE